MNDIYCPRIINIRAAKPDAKDSDVNRIPVPRHHKTANISQLTFYTSVPLRFRFLSCVFFKPDLCKEYENIQKNVKFSRCENTDDFACFYYSADMSQPQIKHYLLTFIPGTSLTDADKIASTIVSTVNWLNLNDGKFFFEIFFCGRPRFPVFPTTLTNDVNKELKKNIKNHGYDEREKMCKVSIISDEEEFPKLIFTGNDPIKVKS